MKYSLLLLSISVNLCLADETKHSKNISPSKGFELTTAQRLDISINGYSASEQVGPNPIQLLLVDPLGRRAGYNPSIGEFDHIRNHFHEIPDSYYDPNSSFADVPVGVENFTDHQPLLPPTSPMFRELSVEHLNIGGDYTLAVLGVGKSTYAVTAFLTVRVTQVILNETFYGFALHGTTDTFKLTYNPYLTPQATLVKQVTLDTITKDLMTAFELNLINDESLYQLLLGHAKKLSKSNGQKREDAFKLFISILNANKEKIIRKAYDVLKEDAEYLADRIEGTMRRQIREETESLPKDKKNSPSIPPKIEKTRGEKS